MVSPRIIEVFRERDPPHLNTYTLHLSIKQSSLLFCVAFSDDGQARSGNGDG
jgi:hypothetical protein